MTGGGWLRHNEGVLGTYAASQFHAIHHQLDTREGARGLDGNFLVTTTQVDCQHRGFDSLVVKFLAVFVEEVYRWCRGYFDGTETVEYKSSFCASGEGLLVGCVSGTSGYDGCRT